MVFLLEEFAYALTIQRRYALTDGMKKLLYLLLLLLFHMKCFSYEITYLDRSKDYGYKMSSKDLIVSAKSYYGENRTSDLDRVYNTVFYIKNKIVSEVVAQVGRNDDIESSSWILYDSSLRVKTTSGSKIVSEKVITSGETECYETTVVKTGIITFPPGKYPMKEWHPEKRGNGRLDTVTSVLIPVQSSFFEEQTFLNINGLKLISYLETGEEIVISGKDLVNLVCTSLRKNNLSPANIPLDEKNQKVVYFELYDDIYPTERNVYTFTIEKAEVPEEIMAMFPVLIREK